MIYKGAHRTLDASATLHETFVWCRRHCLHLTHVKGALDIPSRLGLMPGCESSLRTISYKASSYVYEVLKAWDCPVP
ncbi:hypothetical protein HBH56_219420 [Parastagonospora nodorum]|uniref:Uncharacterized protein n=1 Tax=Phaeosphaeria nodorum (strain SN15 / ATCC MYA-4574 / FGSC 10173) TaxID=321614 RepID=A0A7U2FA17_PHANO|nr:hypothetical protein HBH56_219420 [Parastagonospora nodorum]QRD01183.1 hypothetical protein JI435_416280 [Parastagonospora nodorum SN15]KAH3922034.1 hypothetical protein HBH54_229550 [Parastagonospora nodorum]KAH3958706.1 hypothetical protein HBH51_206700 [Parastagonospora nodorum]KAH3961104.1 hypothetical protein HBH52_232730 [Parastagonospora nodorum]